MSATSAASCARCAGVSWSATSSRPPTTALDFASKIVTASARRRSTAARSMVGAASRSSACLRSACVVVGIGRDLGEFRRDDVVDLGFLRRAGADRIERARDGVLDEGQAGALPPGHVVHPRRHRRGAADAERDAAGEDADERHGARPGRSAGPGALAAAAGGSAVRAACGTLSMLVMTISLVDGARRAMSRKEANGRTFRAIRAECKEP